MSIVSRMFAVWWLKYLGISDVKNVENICCLVFEKSWDLRCQWCQQYLLSGYWNILGSQVSIMSRIFVVWWLEFTEISDVNNVKNICCLVTETSWDLRRQKCQECLLPQVWEMLRSEVSKLQEHATCVCVQYCEFTIKSNV